MDLVVNFLPPPDCDKRASSVSSFGSLADNGLVPLKMVTSTTTRSPMTLIVDAGQIRKRGSGLDYDGPRGVPETCLDDHPVWIDMTSLARPILGAEGTEVMPRVSLTSVGANHAARHADADPTVLRNPAPVIASE